MPLNTKIPNLYKDSTSQVITHNYQRITTFFYKSIDNVFSQELFIFKVLGLAFIFLMALTVYENSK